MSDDSSNWHRETITPEMEDVLHDLATAIPAGTYLAGGTGLALQFGHQRSVDLDLFVPAPFDEEQLLQNLQGGARLSAVERAPQTVHLNIGGVKVSVLGYRYPVLFPMERFSEVPVADPRDIAAMKITAIASRGTKRDFIDFYSCRRRYGLNDLFGVFVRKYDGTGYNIAHIVKSLTYFQDAEQDPMPHMLVPLDWEEVKAFFRREAPRLL